MALLIVACDAERSEAVSGVELNAAALCYLHGRRVISAEGFWSGMDRAGQALDCERGYGDRTSLVAWSDTFADCTRAIPERMNSPGDDFVSRSGLTKEDQTDLALRRRLGLHARLPEDRDGMDRRVDHHLTHGELLW